MNRGFLFFRREVFGEDCPGVSVVVLKMLIWVNLKRSWVYFKRKRVIAYLVSCLALKTLRIDLRYLKRVFIYKLLGLFVKSI